MEPRSLGWIAEACQGQLTGSGETLARGVSTDSRSIAEGDLFVAIRGERFDGHQFIDQVLPAGPAGLVVDRPVDWNGASSPGVRPGVIQVDDTRKALGRLASAYRSQFEIPLIAVAGSNGKTSTKEILSAILGQAFQVLKSPASFNNDIGVPLTLLRLDSAHEVGVLEVGSNHPGELEPLLNMVRPELGVLTGIGREHLEHFGDLDGVIREEGMLAVLLPKSGTLFLNGDQEASSAISGRCRAKVVRIGLNETNEWVAHRVQCTGSGYQFEVSGPDPSWNGTYTIPLLGRPQAVNALMGIAVAAHLGMKRQEVVEGLARCRPAPMRLELQSLDSGVWILNDAYNANADSTRVALETLKELPCMGRRIAVLGDMEELGDHARGAHVEAGQLAAELKLNAFFAVGRGAVHSIRAAQKAGLRDAFSFTCVQALGEALAEYAAPGDLVLLKASRAVRLERIADFLKHTFSDRGSCQQPETAGR